MWTLVPDDDQILLATPATAAAQRPCEDVVTLPELRESHLSTMPAGAEDLDGVGHAAGDSRRHGRVSNHARSTALPQLGSR